MGRLARDTSTSFHGMRMKSTKIRKALLSVYDKTGIVEFARALVEEFGVELLSTGGTASLLKENGIPVTLVEHVTGFPEMMDGRVKTLHPKVHAAILADRDNPDHMRELEKQGIEPIDMVVVNLYPFARTVADPACTFEQAIEMIDIGGPCMLRAAAKNHRGVIPAIGEDSYMLILEEMRATAGESISANVRTKLATAAFQTTSRYDLQVARFLSRHPCGAGSSGEGDLRFEPPVLGPGVELRYGENPHQHARFRPFLRTDTDGPNATGEASIVRGRHNETLSFNNYGDAAAALELCKEVTRTQSESGLPVCVFVKHTNACGVGVARKPDKAYERAYLGDPNAAMGGILACNFAVTAEFATAVMQTYACWGKSAGAGGFFVEVWIAPDFDESAIEVVREAKAWGKRVRLLAVGDMSIAPDESMFEYKSITGGMLAQSRDLVGLKEDEWQVVTKRAPTDAELADLRLAYLVCKHSKSNAITVCKDGMLIGNGAGQMSRVMSCRIATWLAKDNGHAERLSGAAAASDAFFPFPDGPDILMDAGVTAIIQPGGSKRDADSITACDGRGAAMIFTGKRHFKH